MTATTPPPPGWYDDPEHSGRLRWWDGVGWTDYRSAPVEAASGASVESTGVGPVASAGVTPTTSVASYPSAGSAFSMPAAEAAVPELASAGDRLLAAILDTIVVYVLVFAVSIVTGFLSAISEPLGSLFAVVGMLGYFAVLFISGVMGEGRLGQSYGKHLMGVKVISTRTSQPIGSPAAFGRSIVRVVGVYALMLGVLWILWDPQRQGWHDKAVGSVVVKAPQSSKMDPYTFLRTIIATRPPA